MKQCGHCGAQNPDHHTACTGCGRDLPAAAMGLGGTMVMNPVQPPAPEPKAPARLRGTIMGIAPPDLTPPPAAPAPPSPAQLPTASPSQPPGPKFAGTMIGLAPPGYPSPPPPPEPPPPEALPAVGDAAAGQRLRSVQKTVLGVARPGIAPLNPGQAKQPVFTPLPPAPAPPPVSWHPPPVEPPPSAYNPAPISPRRPEPRRISVTATLAIVGSAMLLVLAVVAYFMLRGHGSVTARASLDEHGNEQLALSCAECPDGTKTWIDSSPVTFQAGKATLRLLTPLKVGENPLVLVLERPGRSREEIALSLPIEFRVRGSTEELAQESPKVVVVANVRGGTKLEVGGKPATPDPSGVARFEYEVANDLSGPEASVTTLERMVPYKAVSGAGVTQEGQVQIRIGVTPLIVDAPGNSLIVADKELVIAGRTAPGAALKVGTQSVVLDPEGRFVSKQALAPGDNSFTVRSTLKDLAPRLVKVSVRRSDDLERDVALVRSTAQTSYPEVLRTGDASIGRSLTLEGQLFDVRHDGYTSVLLIDVKGGCKKVPCLSKVLFGVPTSLQKGGKVTAFGKVVRFVDGPRTGERIPEVRADLVVAGAK